MLRELNINEMNAVSGGEAVQDEIIVNGTRTPDASSPGLPDIGSAGANARYFHNGVGYGSEDEWLAAMRRSVSSDLTSQGYNPYGQPPNRPTTTTTTTQPGACTTTYHYGGTFFQSRGSNAMAGQLASETTVCDPTVTTTQTR